MNRGHIELLNSNVKALKKTVAKLETRVCESLESEAFLREQLDAGMAVSVG
jgi:hypothetical protein